MTLCVTILTQLSTQAPVPTTVVVDLLPLAIGGALVIKGGVSHVSQSHHYHLVITFTISGIFVGNGLAHVANEDRNGGFKRKRKVRPTSQTLLPPGIVLGGPLVGPIKPRYSYPTPFRYLSDGV